MVNIYAFIIQIIAIMLCLTVHETAHGWTAYMLGDSTAKEMGRISLNPLRHIDILGLMCLVIFGFGWGKPVQCDERNFKHPAVGMALTALAGPVSNFVFAFVAILLSVSFSLTKVSFLNAMGVLFSTAAGISVYLGVFNLIPIPPLDGSKVLFMFLPQKLVWFTYRYAQYFVLILVVLLYSGVLRMPLAFAANYVYARITNSAAAVVYGIARLF